MATRKKHTPEQVVRKLATADRMLNEGKDVADVCRELQVSEQTYYRWRNQFGGMKADDAKRLKELEGENATLWNAAAVLSTLDSTPVGMMADPAAVMIRAGLLVGDTELSAGQALGDRFGLPIPARLGMSPFGGDTRGDIWREVDPRRFLQPGQTTTRFAAALRIAFELPVCGAVAVGTSRTDHLRERATAPDLDTDQARIKSYRELLSSARAAAHRAAWSRPAGPRP